MFYADDKPRPHLVSIKTGKKYFYREGTGEDRLRVLKQLETDDTPAPEPESEPVQVVPVRSRPMDADALIRITSDEMKLQSSKK